MSSFGTRQTETLLSTNSGSTTGISHALSGGPFTVIASEVGTGAVTATVVVEVTNVPSVTTSWLTLGTITLSGTTTAQDGFASAAAWGAIRAKTTAISGTSAIVTVTLAY